MGRKVKLIRERLDAIASDRNAFNFTERLQDMNVVRIQRREETHSFVPIHQFIGRDADKDFVTKHLLQYDVVDNVSVISIVGIGGMGKTTLAQSVYNSKEIKRKFELRMWVCVSDPFDVKLICENIIMSATHDNCERLPMDGVRDKLKSSIDGRKYLLVLDDVWNESSMEWEKLEVLLSGGAKGSKILTARAELVARAARSIATHVLKGLSPEDSWVLFKQVAFKRGVERVTPTMEGIGKEVVEKCVGVPLVIKAIGSMLAIKQREIDWLDFKKNDLPRVAQDSEGTVLPIMRLSYDYLPAPLKRCFMYCAIYPKGHPIDKEELIGMWMGHGLVQSDSTTRSLEDAGERHFVDLLDRSFFEVHEKVSYFGVICIFYKMHDFIHDLAQSVGGDEFYNPGSAGIDYVDRSTRHAWVSMDEPSSLCEGEKLRTLVLTRSGDEEQMFDEPTCTFEQLRVLRLEYLGLTSVPQFVGGLRHLYYLDLSHNSFVSLPESICSLFNLQTLILSHCPELEELPAGTRDLASLRRLDVSGCDKLRHMPRGLEELTCLQTLTTFVAGRSCEECAHVCELKSLVSLRGELLITNLRAFKCAKCERNKSCVLKELKLVRELELKWRSIDVEEEEEELDLNCAEEEEERELLLIESLKPHPNLERLTIQFYDCKKLPSWLDRENIRISLPNIVYIKLQHCGGWRHLPALGLLPSLQQLHVQWMDSVEYLIDDSTLEQPYQLLFPSLKELYLDHMTSLKGLVEPTEASRTSATNNRYFLVLEKLETKYCPLFLSDGRKEDVKQFLTLLEVHLSWLWTETLPSSWLQYLPHLQTLKLSYCWDIVSLPEWLQYLPNLQTLVLDSCHKIVSLPEWMDNLTSLQQLHLRRLDSLATIPDCLKRLTSLQQLLVRNCPRLVSRCEKETGVDWHNIKHIPNIIVINRVW